MKLFYTSFLIRDINFKFQVKLIFIENAIYILYDISIRINELQYDYQIEEKGR